MHSGPRRLPALVATGVGALAPTLLTASTASGAPPDAPPHSVPDRVTRSTTTDPADTRGPLDIAAVTHRIAVRGRSHVRVAFGIRTYRPLRSADLNRRHRNLTIELGTDATPGASRNIRVYARNGRLRADLISNATRKRIARLAIRRTGRRSIRIRGPRRLTGAQRYFVVSRYENPVTAPCGKVGNTPITCGDEVPRRGWLRMDRPAWPRSSGSTS